MMDALPTAKIPGKDNNAKLTPALPPLSKANGKNPATTPVSKHVPAKGRPKGNSRSQDGHLGNARPSIRRDDAETTAAAAVYGIGTGFTPPDRRPPQRSVTSSPRRRTPAAASQGTADPATRPRLHDNNSALIQPTQQTEAGTQHRDTNAAVVPNSFGTEAAGDAKTPLQRKKKNEPPTADEKVTAMAKDLKSLGKELAEFNALLTTAAARLGTVGEQDYSNVERTSLALQAVRATATTLQARQGSGRGSIERGGAAPVPALTPMAEIPQTKSWFTPVKVRVPSFHCLCFPHFCSPCEFLSGWTVPVHFLLIVAASADLLY